jgi:hypothetical protein
MVRLHGTTLVGRLFYDGQRGFEACWVTACSCYLLSSNRDDSFHKIKTSSVFLPRELRRTVVLVCVCLSLSKNENNNGFDTIGSNSSLFDYKRGVNIHFTVVFALFSLVVCFRMDENFCIMSTI